VQARGAVGVDSAGQPVHPGRSASMLVADLHFFVRCFGLGVSVQRSLRVVWVAGAWRYSC
jgi:hypothetical protein